MKLGKWLAAARKAAEHWWCYPELVDDHIDACTRAAEHGEDPDKFVRELGEELDLHKFGPGWGGW